MTDEVAAAIQAFASAASLAVAVGAVIVAIGAKRVAAQSVETARRQMALAAVPYVVVPDYPSVTGSRRGPMIRVGALNSGTVPALAVRAEVAGAESPSFAIPETREASAPRATLAPGDRYELSMPVGKLQTPDLRDTVRPRPSDPVALAEFEKGAPRWAYRFLVVRIDYHGPHGARLSQSYDFDTWELEWRLRRVEIDPADGGEPIVVPVSR